MKRDRSVEEERPEAAAAGAAVRPKCDPMALYELEGRMGAALSQTALWKFTRSYSQIGRIKHNHLVLAAARHLEPRSGMHVSDIAFNTEGNLVASVGTTGYLYVHEYDSMYSHATKKLEDQIEPLAAYPVFNRLQAVRWNPLDQTQVACISGISSNIFCFDIRDSQPDLSEMFMTRADTDSQAKAFYDFLFREHLVFACGYGGRGVNIWDRRKSHDSTSVLDAPKYVGSLMSMEISADDRVLYAGSESGHILAWDLRGGRNASAFSSSCQIHHAPVAVLSISKAMEKIPHLKCQTGNLSFGVTCLSMNPACEAQLAFGLNCGWSGVLDMSTFDSITHMHCPPPPWDLEQQAMMGEEGYKTKLAWLSNLPAVAVVNSSDQGEVQFLDFTPGLRSQHHVENRGENKNPQTPVVLQMSEQACSLGAHPFDDRLIVGTRGYMNLLAHKKQSVVSESQHFGCVH